MSVLVRKLCVVALALAGVVSLPADLLAQQQAHAAPAQSSASAKPREPAADISQTARTASIRIPRVGHPPRIEDFAANGADGLHTAELARVTGFRHREPGDGTPVSQDTTAFLGYDDVHLYVVFVCRDNTADLRAHLARREDIESDDHVALYLDTFHDQRRAYVFASNGHGIQLDGIFTEGQGNDFSFDTLWYSSARITRFGYVVQMTIPFKSLRFSSADVQSWRIALNRFILRNNELSFWPYVTRRDAGFANQFAELEGLQEISPGRNLQFIPYGIFTSARFLNAAAPGGPAYDTKNEFRGGLDSKIVVRDAVTFDIALNPDFSQVESDEPQVTINQRFEVFFPEKRPFFIENAGYFITPINLFFSRRIADPQFGVRFTGKAGQWSFGGIGIDDRQPSAQIPPSGAFSGFAGECDPADDRRSAVGVARVQREFAKQSFIGVLFTDREHASCSNKVVSLDTRLRFGKNWLLTGQYMRSYTRAWGNEKKQGPAYWLDLSYVGRNFVSSTRFSDRSPDFRTFLGFVPRVDVREAEQYLAYTWRPNRKHLLSFGPSVFSVINFKRDGRLQDWFVDYEWRFEFTRQTIARFGGNEAFELFQGIEFRKHERNFGFSTQWLDWLSTNASVAWRSTPNYFPAAPLAPFLGSGTDVSFSLSIRPTPRFRFDQTYFYTRLGTRSGSTPAGFAPDSSIFNDHILRSKVNYQFTREFSLRAILDYNATLPNNSLTTFQRSKRLTGDVLFTYLLHPGTALYVGYSDRAENQQIVVTGTPPMRTLQITPGLSSSTGRQFFVKFSYLLRF
jgi:hypothetical protein